LISGTQLKKRDKSLKQAPKKSEAPAAKKQWEKPVFEAVKLDKVQLAPGVAIDGGFACTS
jgi:hypothetical protein